MFKASVAVHVSHGLLFCQKSNVYRLTCSVRGSLKLYNFMYNHGVSMSKGLFLERKKKVFDKYLKLKHAAVV